MQNTLTKEDFRFQEPGLYQFENVQITLLSRVSNFGSGKKTVYTCAINGVIHENKDILYYKRLFGVDIKGHKPHKPAGQKPAPVNPEEPVKPVEIKPVEPIQAPVPVKPESAEIRHQEFEYIKGVVSNKVCPYLFGPAGSGKNVICQQLADALGLQFYYSNSITQEYKLTGYQDANGIFHDTELYKAATLGGLFMIDELDASIPEVLTLLNAALANGYFVFGDGQRVTLHPDFRCIAAGNTCGLGSSDQYTGRYTIDAASLNRFFVIRVGYDTRVEKLLSAGRQDILDFIYGLRDAARATCTRMVLGYRNIMNLAKLSPLAENGITKLSNIVFGGVAAGLDNDTISNLCANYPGDTSNKYYKALRDLAKEQLTF